MSYLQSPSISTSSRTRSDTRRVDQVMTKDERSMKGNKKEPQKVCRALPAGGDESRYRVRVEKGAILITIRGPLKVHNWVQHQINQSIEQSARRQ